jgi:hypothetical protein
MTQYSMSDVATPFSDTSASINLTAAVVSTYTVPGTVNQKYRCMFRWGNGSAVYVGLNATPAAPTSGAVHSTPNIEFMPDAKYVKGGDILSFYSTLAVTDSGLSLLSING